MQPVKVFALCLDELKVSNSNGNHPVQSQPNQTYKRTSLPSWLLESRCSRSNKSRQLSTSDHLRCLRVSSKRPISQTTPRPAPLEPRLDGPWMSSTFGRSKKHLQTPKSPLFKGLDSKRNRPPPRRAPTWLNGRVRTSDRGSGPFHGGSGL